MSVAPPDVAETPSQPTVSCYSGKVDISATVGGPVVDAYEAVVRRTADPGQGTIREEVATSGAHGGRFDVLMKVQGNAFTMNEAGGAFTGTGTLQLTADWAGGNWTSHAVVPGGIEVDSQDEATATHMHVSKDIKRQGQLLAHGEEIYEHLDCADFDAGVTRLAPAPRP
jgi:hypothetical protein